MLHSDSASHTLLEGLAARHDFALHTPEQRFQRELTVNREIGASAVFLPTMNFQKGLLYREPYRDPAGNVLRSADGGLQTFVPKDNFIAVAYRLGTNIVFKQYLAQYSRAFSVAYNRNRQFRHTVDVGNDLLALARTAETLDRSGTRLSAAAQATLASPVQDLVGHAPESNRLMADFAHGELEVTTANVQALSRQLEALATLAREKAASGPPAKPSGRPGRPAAFLHAVMEKDTIDHPRQAQLWLATLAGLLAEGAIPLGQEQLFVPQEKIYLDKEQVVALSEHLSARMEVHGLSLNHDARDKPLVQGLPAGAMVKRSGQGYAALTPQELTAFASDTLRHVKGLFPRNPERLFAYADDHYPDVQQILAGRQEVHSVREATDAQPAPIVQGWAPDKPHKSVGQQIANDPMQIFHHAKLLGEHLTRPEAKHEMHKLFARGVATYALNFPLSIVSHILLGFTKRDDHWRHIPMTQANWQKHGIGLVVTPDNLKSSLFEVLVYPVVESVGSVGVVEAARYSRKLTLESAGRMDTLLVAGVKTAARRDAGLQQAISKLAHASPVREVLAAHPQFQGIEEMLARREPASPADYARAAEFYHAVSEQVVHDAGQVFAPYLASGETLGDALHKVTHQPAQTIQEATLSLSFLRSVTDANRRNIGWLEYLPPEVAHINPEQMGQLAAYVNAQAEAAGLQAYQPAGAPQEGLTPGELVRVDASTGQTTRAETADIIRLANVSMQKFRAVMARETFEEVTQGRFSENYLGLAETLMLEQARFAPSASAGRPENQAAGPAQPWNTVGVKLPIQGRSITESARYAVRPEARHQMDKLFWRMLFTRALFTPVQVSENLLWKHKIHIDRNAPLTTQAKQFFGSDNIKQSLWTLGSFPIAFSYGITALWEFNKHLFGNEAQALEASRISDDFLSAAIHSSAHVAPGTEKALLRDTASNPALLRLSQQEQYRRLPEIFAKPAQQRTEEETALASRFFAEAGDRLMEYSAGILTGSAVTAGEDAGHHLRRIITQPAASAGEAVQKLALAQGLLAHNAQFVGMLRYYDPKTRELDTRQLLELSSFIDRQAIAAGFAIHDGSKPGICPSVSKGEMIQRDGAKWQRIDESNLIRFANVVGEKVSRLLPLDRKEGLPENFAARYRSSIDTGLARSI